LHDPKFDQAVFPAVRRKVALIEQMLTATEPLRQPVFGPIVPSDAQNKDLDLVAKPARNGLIYGRMDRHYPVLFVNAVSYQGLLSAAEIAERVGQPQLAAQWRQIGARLRKDWNAIFETPERDDARTYISGLWPSWVVSNRVAYESSLNARWTKIHTTEGGFRDSPLWTYFELAEAHQWLLIGRPERAWIVVDWFRGNQSSPGLYSWWEGRGEENSFGRWANVRGWVRPDSVTPHYWTAAEMLSLQLDMLAYVDESETEPTLVVGGGVKGQWLKTPMTAGRVPTRAGVVDWNWADGRMRVIVHGNPVRVRLGPMFPIGTSLETDFKTDKSGPTRNH
jgi:hypothetical protein